MLLSHHLISGPQFSSHPKSSGTFFCGSGGAGGAGGCGGTGGPGYGEGGDGGEGGVGDGGVGEGGGVGAGAGGTFLQSPFPVHLVVKSLLHKPPLPLAG